MRKIDIRRIKSSSAGNNQVLSYSNTAETWVASSNVVLDNVTVNANLTVNGAVSFAGSITGIPTGNSSVAGVLKVVDSTSNTDINVAAAANAVARAVAYADSKAATAYSNAVSTAATDASTKAGTAYSNAVSTAATDASSKADTAYSNATSYADTKAAAAYTNAVAYAASNSYVNSTFAPKASPTFTGTVNLPDTVISGNLTVTGNTTYINTTELDIGDNLIVLNADLPGGSAPTQNAGIIINRGSSANSSLFWNETDDWWQTSGGLFVTTDIVAGNVVYGEYVTANQEFTSYGNITAVGDVIANTVQANSLVTTVDVSVSNTITLSGTTTVNSSVYTGTANSATYFGGQQAGYYTNATNLSTGTVPSARLPASNTSQAGIVQMIDSTGNTSITIAATANSVKAAYDAATSAATLAGYAYSNAHNDAVNYASNAYSNAVAFAANATNIASGTLDTARLPSTANIATQINVGANLSINTSSIQIGNSTANVVIGTQAITVGDLLVINSSGFSMPTGNAVINDIRAVSHVFVGNNVFMNTTAFAVGNTTVYTLIQSDEIHANGAYITSVNAVTVGGNTALTLLNASTTAYTNAVSDAATDASTKANAAYANAIAYSGNAAAAYANAASLAVSLSDAAFSNAIAYSGNSAQAYSNAVTFASNASNISSGTLNTARLPATANIATAVNVGANLVVNTSTIQIGNSTVNTGIVATGISFPDSSFQIGSALGGSSNTYLIFNDSGYSNGSAALAFVKTTNTLTVGNTINSNNISGNTVSVTTVSGANLTSTGNTTVGDTLKLGANGVQFSDGSKLTSAPIDPIAFAIALG